ncbi:MAG: HAD family phosphatase [Candidatus Saccharimonadales bacterium]
MSQKFAVFDIDGTLIRWQLFHAIVGELIKLGALDKQVGQEIQTARMHWKQRTHDESFREYEKVLVAAYEHALANLKNEDFTHAVDAVFNEYKDQVYRYTRNLIRELKAAGYMILAISGSHHEVIQKIAEHYGFDDVVGQIYEQQNGRFTGEHTTPMYHKDVVLNELIAKHNLDLEGSIAVGDSESDIPMLALVEQAVAFNPSRGLFAEAQKQGWKVVLERKNMIYELEPEDGRYILKG